MLTSSACAPHGCRATTTGAGRSRGPELCSQLEAACGQDLIPLLLAAPARQVFPSEPLESLAFDAFIDLSWEPSLIEQCLSLVVARVRAGRGVAAIQHQVLGAVRKEVARLKDLTLRDELTPRLRRYVPSEKASAIVTQIVSLLHS